MVFQEHVTRMYTQENNSKKSCPHPTLKYISVVFNHLPLLHLTGCWGEYSVFWNFFWLGIIIQDLKGNILKIKIIPLMINLIIKFLHSSRPSAHAAALVWILCVTSVTAALISCTVIAFTLLLFDSREASELTSLSRTGLGKLSRPDRKSGLLIAAGLTCRGDEG